MNLLLDVCVNVCRPDRAGEYLEVERMHCELPNFSFPQAF